MKHYHKRISKYHLQQASYKEGIDTKPPVTTLRENAGFNDMQANGMRGEPVEEFNISSEMLEWFKGFQEQNEEE